MKPFAMFTLLVWGCVASDGIRAEPGKGTVALEIAAYEPQPPQIVVVGPPQAVPYEPQPHHIVVVGPPTAVPYQPSAPTVVQVGPPKKWPATKEDTLQEVRKELQDLRRRLRELERRLREFDEEDSPGTPSPKYPTQEEVEKHFNDLRERDLAQYFAPRRRKAKWPVFQPGPGGKDRFEESGGSIGVIGPDGKYTHIRVPPEWPAPTVPLKW